MSCPDDICRLVTCPDTDGIPSYLGAYSLQSGVAYSNLLIAVPAPGGGTYYVPPGTIVINLPPGATSVSYQGCQSTVTLPIPSGSTATAIQGIVNQVMQQVAEQLAICNAPDNPHNPIPSPYNPVTYSSNEVFRSCPSGLLMNLIGTLPKNVFFSIDGLTLQAGVFVSPVSVEDANTQGDNFLIGLISGGTLVQCGYWNTEQTFVCPDSSVQTVPADTYFRMDSQTAADNLALAAAEAACSSTGMVDWSGLFIESVSLTFEGNGQNPTFNPASGFSASFDTTATILAGQSMTADFSFAESVAEADYNGPAANCKLTTNNSTTVDVPDVDMHIVYIFMYVSGVFESTVAVFNMRDFPSTVHDWTFTVPDTGGILKQIRVEVQNDLSMSGATNNPEYQFTISGVFSNA